MKKKYLSLFLALIMILGVIPTSIFAETGTQKYKITFIASKDVAIEITVSKVSMVKKVSV
ncbi:hypothetical protein [uncultured Peptoniphilus sp.]|uniref:hypothetical protein n=1 Tax=uncultured Peptoniphilus sp. TaxID=254354 RepID=UPI002596E45C|nr:hypothetical protein [uncultured Peptoniphilus sp.]